VSAAAIASSVRAAFTQTLAFPPTQQHDTVLVHESGIKCSLHFAFRTPDAPCLQATVPPPPPTNGEGGEIYLFWILFAHKIPRMTVASLSRMLVMYASYWLEHNKKRIGLALTLWRQPVSNGFRVFAQSLQDVSSSSNRQLPLPSRCFPRTSKARIRL
jgi:hypothetical protein